MYIYRRSSLLAALCAILAAPPAAQAQLWTLGGGEVPQNIRDDASADIDGTHAWSTGRAHSASRTPLTRHR